MRGTVPEDLERRILSVDETAEILGVGRATAYGAIRRGELPAVRIGRRLVVPGVAIARLLEEANGSSPPE